MPRAPLKLVGKSAPATGLDSPAFARPQAQPFVGREREVAVLRGALEEAAAGRGRIVLLVGEPGIGKSRTADEIAEFARESGAEVLFGRCYEGPGAPAFWPWVQILRAYARERDADTLRAALGPAIDDVAQIWPELARSLPEVHAATATAPPSDQARFRLFDGMAGFFTRASRERPLLLVLDDLHGADRPSLILLQFLAREMRDARVAILGTFRDVALAFDHPLAEALGELARERIVERVSLRGLGEADVAHYIELVAGFAPPPALVGAIHSRTSGNPLFVSELVRFLLDDGRLADPAAVASWGAALPEAVRVVIGRRLAHLSPTCVDALTVASCIGREFAENALGVACGLDRSRVHEVLEEAHAARLVDAAPDRFGRYRFTHALVRDALYGEVSASDRPAIHRRVAEAVESVSAGDRDVPLAELAASFFAAGDERAIEYARRAGDRAMTLLAFEEAASQYDLALRALDALPSLDEERRSELLLALGDAQNRSGEIEASKQTILQVVAGARKRGDRLLLSRAALAFGERGVWGEVGSGDDTLTHLLEEAVSAWGEEEHALQARLLARLATSLLYADEPARRRVLSERALAMARATGDPGALTAAMIAHHAIVWTPDNTEERLAIASDLLQRVDESREPEGAFQAHLWRLLDLVELGELRAADVELTACRRIADRLRDPPHRWQVEVLRATRASIEGRFEQGEALAAELLAGKGHGRGTTSIFWLVIWAVRWLQGRLGELEGSLAPLIEILAAASSVMRPVLAMVYRQQGRKADARAQFGALAVDDFAGVARDQNFLVSAGCLAEVCAYLEDARAAQVLSGMLAPYARSHIVDPNGVTYLGAIAYYLAMVERTLGRFDDAVGHLEDAIRSYAAMNALPWLAHARYELARVLEKRDGPGDRGEAIELVAQARATAESLGLELLQREIDDLAPRLRGPRRATPRASAARGARVEADRAETAVAETASGEAVCKRVGDVWTISFEDQAIHLRDSRGLRHLARLLAEPGREVHVTALASPGGSGDYKGIDADLQIAANLGGTGTSIDRDALASYRRRRDALRAEIEEAERLNDIGRAMLARDEMEALEGELLAASRNRRVATHVERARQSVAKSLAKAIARIDEEHPRLGRHLMATIRRGYYCLYLPDPRSPIRWSV